VSIEIHPHTLRGPWDGGYALDVHIVSSEFLGYDGAGQARFDSARSEVGDLLYRLKYRNDQTALEPLVEAAADFLHIRRTNIDAIRVFRFHRRGGSTRKLASLNH
jgi:hypothetical protein